MNQGVTTGASVPADPADTVSLWRRPDFVSLWIGRTVSTFGSHISGTAIPLAALLMLGATAGQMGLLTALGAAPVLLVGLPAGVWVDRLPRRPILIAADLGRAALLLTIPVAFAFHWLAIWQLFAVVFLVGVLTVFAEVAGHAFLPGLVPSSHLVEANGKLGVGDSMAEIGGPSVAGVLVQWIGAPIAIVFDAASFVVSAVSLRLIRVPEPARPVRGQASGGLAREALDGVRLVVGHTVLRALAGSMATFEFFGYFIATLYAFFAIRTLHLSAAAVGTLVGLGGISALVGSLVAERVARRFGLGRTLAGTLLVYGALDLLIPLAGGPPVVAYAMMAAPQILGDAFIAIHLITQTSLRQAVVPERMLGRAAATLRVLEQGVGPLGALIAGGLATITTPRLALAVGACGVMLASLWLIVSPVRNIRSLPPRPAGGATRADADGRLGARQ